MNSISRRQFILGATSSAALLAGGCAAPFGDPQSYLTDVVDARNMSPVFHWTDIALQALRDQTIAPPLATRALAMGHVAGFMAVNGIGQNHHSAFGTLEGPAGADPDVAYGVAFSHAVAEHFQQPFVVDRANFLRRYRPGEAKSLAVGWGEKVAAHVVRLRTNDGAEPSKVNFYLDRYPRRRDTLRWTPTGPLYDAGEGPAIAPTFDRALLPGFGAVDPWGIKSVRQFRAPAFLDPASPEFAEEFAEIREIGASNSRTRTRDQAEIALFWEDGPWGITPPGHFTLIAIQLLQHRNLTLAEQARAFALISMAMADAGIATWDSKFAHDIIRPETAIRYRASAFGNRDARVRADENWKSFIPTPPFPTYTSGHSCFGAAATRMLAHILGRDRISFSGRSPDLVIWPKHLENAVRHWTSLSAAAEENGLSRIYGGVHWNIDNVQALRIGRDIADHIHAHSINRSV